MYTQLIPLKQKEVLAANARYKGGLDKLEFAASQVWNHSSLALQIGYVLLQNIFV